MGSLLKNADIFSPDKIQVGSLENILLNNFTKNSKEGFFFNLNQDSETLKLKILRTSNIEGSPRLDHPISTWGQRSRRSELQQPALF